MLISFRAKLWLDKAFILNFVNKKSEERTYGYIEIQSVWHNVKRFLKYIMILAMS